MSLAFGYRSQLVGAVVGQSKSGNHIPIFTIGHCSNVPCSVVIGKLDRVVFRYGKTIFAFNLI